MEAIIDLDAEIAKAAEDAAFSLIGNDLLGKGYSVRVNSLPHSLADLLNERVVSISDSSFQTAAIGPAQNTMQNNFVRSQKLKWITGDSDANIQWLSWAERLQVHLNRSLFLGLFSFESHYAHYQPGDFYKRHYDAFRGKVGRTVSIVVYLNTNWLPTDGGELVIYNGDDDKKGLKVMPSYATVVVFLSSEYPHEVLRTNRDRYSIAGWFSTNTSIASRVDPPE